jgi:hypothetical protein
MRADLGIHFEYCVRQFLGDKAYHIAGYFNDDVLFKKYLKKCIKVAKGRILKIDTTTRHKEMLLNNLSDLEDHLRAKKISNESKEIIVDSFWLISRLLGYDGVSGYTFNEPFYYQSSSQYEKEIMSWPNTEDYWKDKQKRTDNIISERKLIYQLLKEKDYGDQEIAQILNTTEYEIKKMKHNI